MAKRTQVRLGLMGTSALLIAVAVLALYASLGARVLGASAVEQEPAKHDFRSLATARMDRVGALLEGASDRQTMALADGFVSRSEHEAAIVAWAKCAEGAGFTVEVLEGRGLRPSQVVTAYPDADGQPDAASLGLAQREAARCRAQHFDAVDTVWALQIAETSGSVDLVAQETRLLECVAAGGVPDVPTDGAILFDGGRTIELPSGDPTIYVQCARREQELTGALSPEPSWHQ